MSKKPERFMLRVEKGALKPADELTVQRLRAKGYSTGDVLSATLKKPRNPRFHRLAHALGQLIADNIEDFEAMDCHGVLKRLQWEANVGCEAMGVRIPGVGFQPVRIPKSLSFDNMDEGEFHEVMRGLSRYVAEHYWPDLEAWQIEEMAQCMVQEAAA